MGVLVLAAGCSQAPETREYELNGQILAIDEERQQVLIEHEDIPNFMMAMTMPFRVEDPSLLAGKQPGDLVTATLVVGDTAAYLSTLTTTGHAELETPPPAVHAPNVLDVGDLVPDALLVDQDGSPLPLASLQGHRVALTFMYTRCPIPDFCPLMDRHFASLQQEIVSRPELSDVRLVTVTLDPDYDTPPILKDHARRLRADPAIWSFVTAAPDELDAFAEQFGIYSQRDAQAPLDIIHNLRTAVIDAEGRLVAVHTGNTWTPADVLADLTATPAPAR